MTITVRVATQAERAIACAQLDPSGRLFLNIQSGRYDPQGIFVALDAHNNITAATLAVVHSGGAGEILPPTMAVEELVQAGLEYLANHGATFAQILHPTGDDRLAVLGIQRVARMVTLGRSVAVLPTGTPPHLERVTKTNRDAFTDTLLKSYTDTTDFPELNGVRSPEDILAGYEEQQPWPWYLALIEGKPAGVLLLGPGETAQEAELQYLGVLPEFRGRGLGLGLTTQALAVAEVNKARNLNLTADERNAPALKIYAKLGFQECGSCVVYLKVGLS